MELMTVICIFSIVMMAVLFVRNEWSNHKDKNDNVRVEKVYQQYTKADLCYFDDDGRKIMNTVWLDVPGIRDGDYIQCYTGNDNSGLFLNYSLSTLNFCCGFCDCNDYPSDTYRIRDAKNKERGNTSDNT